MTPAERFLVEHVCGSYGTVIGALAKRIDELEAMLSPPFALTPALGLRPAEQRLLLALAEHEICTTQALLEATRVDPSVTGDNLVKVRISCMRAKMNDRRSVEITGGSFVVRPVYRVGYSLDDRARWQAFIRRQTERLQPMQVAA